MILPRHPPCETSPDHPVERKIASIHDVGVLWTLTEEEEEDDSQQSSPLPHVNSSASLPGGHACAVHPSVPNTNPGQVSCRGRVVPGERKSPPPESSAVAGQTRNISVLYPRIPVDSTEMKRATWESGGGREQEVAGQMRNISADDATEDEGSNRATPQAVAPLVHDKKLLMASLVDEESENQMRQELTTGLEELRRLRTELQWEIVEAEEVFGTLCKCWRHGTSRQGGGPFSTPSQPMLVATIWQEA